MKRHHKKQIMFKLNVPTGRIYKCAHLNFSMFYNFKVQPKIFKSVFLSRLETINLPNLDVYEVRANALEGALIGYGFDCYGKVTVFRSNYVGSSNVYFSTSKLKELNKDNLDLKFSLNNMLFFEYEGMATLVTLGLGDKIKNAMEIN